MKLIQSEKGFTGAELTVAIVILMIFMTLISTVFFNIYLYFSEAQRNAVASAYVTELAEMIDRMYYQEIEDSVLSEKIGSMNINSGYLVTATVTPYQAGENTKDLVKTVTITASYKVGKTMKSIQVERVKAKEMLITPNQPKLEKGMVPVKYVVTNEETGDGYWVIARETDSTWYSYENKRWANIMLQDGLMVEGDILVTDENRLSLVGKKITTLGSMFVWIPRYAYKIPEENYHTATSGEIDIIFLYSTSNHYIDDNGNMQPITNKEGYKIHPSFQNGATTNYANGEWNTELTGFWVAKFEASSTNPSSTINGGGNTTQLEVKVLPGVVSWRGIEVTNMYQVCKAMTRNENPYGLNENVNTHMMKNSEWGAVAYLTQSKYGNKQTTSDATSGVWNNSYHNGDGNYNTKTGITGENRDAKIANGKTSTTVNEYQTPNGQKGSTTRNIYGIYDMAGGAWEYVAAYVGNLENAYVTFFESVPPYERQKYTGTGMTDSEADRKSNYQSSSSHYGDAIWETSSNDAGIGYNAWGSDATIFPFGNAPFFRRGGHFQDGTAAGIFTFGEWQTTLLVCGFRPVITVP